MEVAAWAVQWAMAEEKGEEQGSVVIVVAALEVVVEKVAVMAMTTEVDTGTSTRRAPRPIQDRCAG